MDYITRTSVVLSVDGQKLAVLTSCIELTAHYVMHIGLDAGKIMNHTETQDGVLLHVGRERQKLPSARIYTIILSHSFCELLPRHGPDSNEIFCLSCSVEREFIFSLLSGLVTVGETGSTMNLEGLIIKP